MVEEYLKSIGDSFKGKTVAISGSGNVAIFATQKVQELGGNVVTMTDSNGYVHHAKGICLDTIKEVKLVQRGRLTDYVAKHSDATHKATGSGCVWDVPVDIALPCATQNELNLESAKTLVANGCKIVGEGANMPSTQDAADYFVENKIPFFPGKAANAGGVGTSALEMSQNSERLSWSFDEVNSQLNRIMVNIFHNIDDAARDYGKEGNYVLGANIAGFKKVAQAMLDQGII
jgi:glutamate dehydrogenase (NADP+)